MVLSSRFSVIEPEVSVRPERVEHEAETMDGVLKGL